MDTQIQDVLQKTCTWIEAERERAKRPNADKFDLTSLSFCVHKGAGPEGFQAGEATLTALRSIVDKQDMPPELKRYDVFTPDEALRLIEAALE